jgi:hypothetical protein
MNLASKLISLVTSETYDCQELVRQLPWKEVLPHFERASDILARLDERMARSDVLAASAQSRAHFREACATLWLEGYLVRLEDLVLHDVCVPKT